MRRRLLVLDSAFAAHVRGLARSLRLLSTREHREARRRAVAAGFSARGFGRFWPPSLAHEVAILASRRCAAELRGRVWLSPREERLLLAQARALGWTGRVFVESEARAA